MIKTVDLPATWFAHTELYSHYSSSLRVGWRWFTAPFERDGKYNGWAKFDTSNLTTLNLHSWQIESANIHIRFGGGIGNNIAIKVYRVIKNATSSVTYETYDGTNAWTVSHGEGLGTDVIATPLVSFTIKDGNNVIPISGASVVDLVQADRPLKFRTENDASKSNYLTCNFLTDVFIRVSYRYSGLVGDATMF